MKQFLYISLVCGVIAGAGIFFNMPQYPTPFIPRLVSIIGMISVIITFKDKDISGLLKLGGIMINLMPLLGSLLVSQQ
ncbi:hypothetical protein BUY43_10625 [Staphylococcus devriesei]|uniref:Uncharacterized protein n=1 Tax=Staphylococcus devriesei TaxID=586733 RepID=A0A2K4DPW6_9STAP|nr:hypothetical protein [Staphylococcus devriesei]MCE5091102.1 hypothetical protein [Staphylococcus devriesei]MCE5098125.1 hypothetical protein [Staphylococcus devriesei]PNZ88859.1 hypothetical protein CD147_04470 [Staphylococcus devriesei]PTE70486.1 hypothetical protein BUY44_10930 [Staphylococcus devriesei]PTF04240.1 hypothetical protein BUY45_04450 [Staphylococcus devriesei]